METDLTYTFPSEDGRDKAAEARYEALVSKLERAWAITLRDKARVALSRLEGEYEDDTEGLHMAVREAVERVMFDSERWFTVKATDISDIAYEVATEVLAER